MLMTYQYQSVHSVHREVLKHPRTRQEPEVLKSYKSHTLIFTFITIGNRCSRAWRSCQSILRSRLAFTLRARGSGELEFL